MKGKLSYLEYETAVAANRSAIGIGTFTDDGALRIEADGFNGEWKGI